MALDAVTDEQILAAFQGASDFLPTRDLANRLKLPPVHRIALRRRLERLERDGRVSQFEWRRPRQVILWKVAA